MARAKKGKPARKATPKKAAAVLLLVGTKKGAWFLRSDPGRKAWKLEGPHFFGHIVNHVVLDPRDGKTLLAAVRTGHLGPTVFRSLDGGKTWKEASRPPAFPKAEGDPKARAVSSTFWLTPGHFSQPDVWFCGTVPHGIFRSTDGGVTWDGVAGFNDGLMMEAWTEKYAAPTPGGAITHSIRIDPRDARHMYVGLSTAGIFESRDAGATWRPLNKGVAADFLPDKDPVYGHDPHCLVIHPANPDRLYHQNHCGLYRLDRPGETWDRIGKAMPEKIRDFGFPIVAHPRDAETVWVFPMDGREVWPRTSIDGKPAVYVTRDGGKGWKRQDKGFPTYQAWFTVLRQALAGDRCDPAGLYVGTTGGDVWASRDEGGSWKRIAQHLPQVNCIEAVTR